MKTHFFFSLFYNWDLRGILLFLFIIFLPKLIFSQILGNKTEQGVRFPTNDFGTCQVMNVSESNVQFLYDLLIDNCRRDMALSYVHKQSGQAIPGSEKISDKKADLIVTNVNIITMLDEHILANANVVIDNGIIIRIEQNTKVDTFLFEKVIDGKGKYLIPGLTDMHAHIPLPEDENYNIQEVLMLFLANGVTTIRGMLGHPGHLELKKHVETGAVTGPRIVTAGPPFSGNTGLSAAETVIEVKAQKESGYDFIKILPGISREVFDSIVKATQEAGIEFAGHVPVDVGIVHALNSGFATIDHVDGYLEGLVPEDAGVNPSENGIFGFNFAHLADMMRIPELIGLTVENEVWVVSTQSLCTRWLSPKPAEHYLSQPEMKYMSATVLESWRESKNNIISAINYSAEQWTRMMFIRKELIRQLNQKELLLLGSDAPQVFNVPGFSVHHEIDALEECGLSSYDILRSATVLPARFFKNEGKAGSIQAGAYADLIIVNDNPLKNMDALKHPYGVILRGKWFSRSYLDQELQKIGEKL